MLVLVTRSNYTSTTALLIPNIVSFCTYFTYLLGQGVFSRVVSTTASSVADNDAGGLLLTSSGGFPDDRPIGSDLGSRLPHDNSIPFMRWATNDGGSGGSDVYIPIVSMDWSGPWLEVARDGVLTVPPPFTRY